MYPGTWNNREDACHKMSPTGSLGEDNGGKGKEIGVQLLCSRGQGALSWEHKPWVDLSGKVSS